MHRSYNSYNPVASKLLQKRWDEKHFSDHRRAVTGVRPEIDSTPPVTFMHLHLKLKKLQLEEERLATIERDNRILLEKMSHTMRNKGQLDNINTAIPKSLSKERRERELLRITRENMNMLKRIAGKKPAISRDSHEKDWKQNLQFMGNISSFPEDWYLRTSKRHHLSEPHLETNRSDDTKTTHETRGSEVRQVSRKSSRKQSEPEPIEEPERKKSPKKVVLQEKPVTPIEEPVEESIEDEKIEEEEEEKNEDVKNEDVKNEDVKNEDVKKEDEPETGTDEYADDFD